jgi:hypothetical protein
MTRSTWLTLLLALSLALGVVLACAGDDDDDDSECALEDICAFEVTECGFEQWDFVAQCISEAPTWLAENCTDANAVMACFCGCYTDNAGDCTAYGTCSSACATEYCS